MKKLLAALLILSMGVCFAACGGGGGSASGGPAQADAGGVKEQTEEFLEGVQGLMGHLNDTYHSVHSNP